MTQFDDYWTSMPNFSAIATHILITLAILVIGWWVSNYCGTLIKRIVDRSSRVDRTILPIVNSFTVWSVRTVVIIAVLTRLGVQTASLVAMLGASALAIGLALQGTLQNFAAGIMILVLRPIRAGEYVSVEGNGSGTIDEVGVFLTRIIKDDGVHLLLPNSLVWGNPIVNYSRNKIRRVDLKLGVRYGEDVQAAIDALQNLVDSNENVLQDPAPRVMVTEYKESTVVVTVWAWIAVDVYWNTRYKLYQEAPQVLADAGLSKPMPLRELVTVTEEAKVKA